MASFLFGAAGFVLTMVALGLLVDSSAPGRSSPHDGGTAPGDRWRRHPCFAGCSDRDAADRGCCTAAGAVRCIRSGRIRQKRIRFEERFRETASGG